MTDLRHQFENSRFATWRASVALAAMVLIVGLIGTTIVSVSLNRSEGRQERVTFDRNTATVTSQLHSELERYTDAVHALAAALGSHQDLRSDDFLTVTAPLQGDQLFGFESVGFVVATDTAGVDSVRNAWKNEGAGDLILVPEPSMRQHYFSVLTRTFHSDVVATSRVVDLAYYPEVTKALETARDINDVAISPAFSARSGDALFAQDVHPAFALAAPAYGLGRDGQREFKGWAVAGLRSQDLAGRAFAKSDIAKFSAISVQAKRADGSVDEVAKFGGSVKGSGFTSTRSIPVAQSLWTLSVTAPDSPPVFDTKGPKLSGFVLAIGTIGTVLFSALVLSLASARVRALQLVEQRTLDLRSDIERRRKTEAALQDARDESERQKTDLAAFTGFAAHDLKTPLSLLSGYVDLIKRGIHDPTSATSTEVLEFCDRAERASVRMRQLIDSLLVFTRARDAELNIRTVDLNSLMHTVVSDRLEQDDATASGVSPVVRVDEALPSLEADPDLLYQVFENLLGNAFKYVPAGTAPDVRISASRDADGIVRIVVADHGIGIPDDRKAGVFTGFVRAHTGGYAGTGLGLAICERIVRRHGGSIEVFDNEGGGSQFVIRLPEGGPSKG